MFTRDSRQSAIDTLIGKSAHLEGDLLFEGGLHVDGHIVGCGARARSAGVDCVGERERLDRGSGAGAERHAGGHRQRAISTPAAAWCSAPTARVEGNVYYGVIEMTLGAQIIGKLVRLGRVAAGRC